MELLNIAMNIMVIGFLEKVLHGTLPKTPQPHMMLIMKMHGLPHRLLL